MGIVNLFRRKLPFLALASGLGFLGISTALGSDTEDQFRPPDDWKIPFSIKIGEIKDAFQGHRVYLPVIKLRGSEEILGFDFLITYDAAALNFMNAAPNPTIYDSPGDYEWEYFTYRFNPLIP